MYLNKITKIVIILFLFELISCQKKTYQETRFLMNTFVEIKIHDEKKEKAKQTCELAFQEMEILDNLLNCYNPKSRISELNRKKTVKSYKVLDEIIKKSIELSKLTDGAFDITIYPLIQLWDFGNNNVPPEKTKIKKILQKINYRLIKVHKNKISLKGDTQIDLSGIAKGYIVDSAIDVLKACNIKNALINAGGDIRVIGNKVWKIGVQHPRKKNGQIMAILEVKNKAVTTSGDYEKYFEYQGKRYHHIIDPKTGYPSTNCISVTIIADDATSADALATGVFVLGAEKGLELVEKLDGVECIIVDSSEKIHLSSGLKDLKLNY
ncbi:MAG: FAD:protein FMN transferase [Endomicrobiia bacterium]